MKLGKLKIGIKKGDISISMIQIANDIELKYQ